MYLQVPPPRNGQELLKAVKNDPAQLDKVISCLHNALKLGTAPPESQPTVLFYTYFYTVAKCFNKFDFSIFSSLLLTIVTYLVAHKWQNRVKHELYLNCLTIIKWLRRITFICILSPNGFISSISLYFLPIYYHNN